MYAGLRQQILQGRRQPIFWARHKFNRRFAGGLIYVVCPRVRTRPEGSEPQQKGRQMYAGLRQQILQGRRPPIFWARHKFNRRFAGGLIYVVRPRVRTRPKGSEPQQKGRRMYAGLRQQILQGRRPPMPNARKMNKQY